MQFEEYNKVDNLNWNSKSQGLFNSHSHNISHIVKTQYYNIKNY
jgi:hypothetical protein